jgi:acid ceramidase
MGAIAYTLPQPFSDKIIGILNATGINLGEIVLYNIFYEIFTLCTSIVGEDQNGNMIHGRNLDFGIFIGWDIKNDTWPVSELLRPLIVNVENMRGGKVAYKTVTFVGFVGLITGVRPGGLSMSLNERFEPEGGFVGLFEWILNIDRTQKWPTFLGREILDSNMTFDEALVGLSKPTLLAPLYYIVGGESFMLLSKMVSNHWQLMKIVLLHRIIK